MFQAYNAGLEAEIAYRRERLADNGSSPFSRGDRLRRTLRGRRIESRSSERLTR